MAITTLKLDQSAKLDFQVHITGASGVSESRFIIEGKNYSISIPCKRTNDGVQAELGAMKGILEAGSYQAKLEVILENKIYTPVIDTINFEQNIEIQAKPVVEEKVEEAVRVGIVSVGSVINEELLRKTQAATVIAKSLGYIPEEKETPEDTISRALCSKKSLSETELKTLKEMLRLAESIGLRYDPTDLPEAEEDEDIDIDKMIDDVDDWDDIIDAYDPSELAIVDQDTGEAVDDNLSESVEELNEVLSRAERLKSRIRFARNAAKRERKLQLALKRHSSQGTLNKRARHLAVKMLEKKLARGKTNLSVSEKERIERIVQTKPALLAKMARKLVSRVRTIEQTRLSHSKFTSSAGA